MSKRINPFEGNDSTPKVIGNDSTPNPLPERGTGLKNDNAGERRAGNPRTNEERILRHEIEMQLSQPTSIKQQWADYREQRRKR